MAVLDDLSGFEFEDLMGDVFRNLGYENVRVATRTADEGRDILMEEVVDGTRRAVVVECKHTDRIGRPVVQKLHSAVATFDYDGPRRGIAVTTGTFTDPAEEYARRLRENNDPNPIELIDGTDLREIAAEVGLDLYNGRIEIICEETLRPYDRPSSAHDPIDETFREINNLDVDQLPAPWSRVTFQPVLQITAETNATFETSVGVIHRVDEVDRLVIFVDRAGPEHPDQAVRELVTDNSHAVTDLDEGRFGEVFDDTEVRHFGLSETEYKEWAIDRLRDHHTTTVTYTGDNNVTYEKTCRPNVSDIVVREIAPVYLPRIETTTELGQYEYPFSFFAAGPSRETIEDGIRQCVHCGSTSGILAFWRTRGGYTYCDNCGSINCRKHTKTERLEGDPVCTGCAVTERFAFKKKYFYSEENLESFRADYEEMPIHRKAMENRPAVAGVVALLVLLITMAVAALPM